MYIKLYQQNRKLIYINLRRRTDGFGYSKNYSIRAAYEKPGIDGVARDSGKRRTEHNAVGKGAQPRIRNIYNDCGNSGDCTVPA